VVSVTEAKFQANVIRRLKDTFPGCVILKNDPGYQQGMLDWTILFGPCWATLEIKARRSSRHQPNQDYFVQLLDDMSFAAFVYPENEEEVFAALQEAFASRGATCVPQS
jgi:hypothetical protein